MFDMFNGPCSIMFNMFNGPCSTFNELFRTVVHLAVFEDDSLKDDNHGNCKLITYKYFLAWILLSRPPRVTEGLSLQLFSSIGALVMQMLVCWSVCLLVYIAESTSKSTWFLFPTAIHSFVYSLLSECPVTCNLGLSSFYLGLAESSFGLTLPIFPTIIFYLCFNLCLTLCFTYFTYVLTYVKLCLTYASTRHMKLTCSKFYTKF